MFILCSRCSTDDTAQYTAMAVNLHGQASSQGSIIVKSKPFNLITRGFKCKAMDVQQGCTRWLSYTHKPTPKL